MADFQILFKPMAQTLDEVRRVTSAQVFDYESHFSLIVFKVPEKVAGWCCTCRRACKLRTRPENVKPSCGDTWYKLGMICRPRFTEHVLSKTMPQRVLLIGHQRLDSSCGEIAEVATPSKYRSSFFGGAHGGLHR